LAERRQREGLARFAGGKSIDASTNKRILKRFESYRRVESLPSGIEQCKASKYEMLKWHGSNIVIDSYRSQSLYGDFTNLWSCSTIPSVNAKES
jgi:nucleosome binding factor SPN SPT16 subunit